MQLEAGKKYTDRRGRVYGPMVMVGQLFGESEGDYCWHEDGRKNHARELQGDLVAEYVEPVKAAEPEYRMLQPGEPFQDGDEYRDINGKWCKAPESANRTFDPQIYFPHRRLVNVLTDCDQCGKFREHGHDEFCKAAEPAPVESPDDWVTQDRVPARVGVDEEYWSNWRPGAWSTVSSGQMSYIRKMSHGDVDHIGDNLSLRCRRKDLPPVPPQKPKTRTVVLKEWMCWDDGSPVVLLWQDVDPTTDGIEYNNFQHARETGDTRTVEIPVT